MPFSHNLKCFLCDIDGFGDVGFGEGGVDEVVVVVCEEYSASIETKNEKAISQLLLNYQMLIAKKPPSWYNK